MYLSTVMKEIFKKQGLNALMMVFMIIIVAVVANSPFWWVSTVISVVLVIAVGFFLSKIWSQINWKDTFDWGLAYIVTLWFMCMCIFLSGALCSLDDNLTRWNSLCEWSIFGWFVTSSAAIIWSLCKGWHEIPNWGKLIMLFFAVIFVYATVMSFISFF